MPSLIELVPEESLGPFILAIRTFDYYASWRRAHIEPRWLQNEKLYLGYLQPRVWKGTNIPRASISSRLVFDQVESIYPVVSSALFEREPAFFDLIPVDNSYDPDQITEYRDRLYTYLVQQVRIDEPPPVVQMKMALHQALIYGDGVVELGWDRATNRPYVEFVDIRDFYMDPRATGPFVDSSPFVFRRKVMTLEDLIQLGDMVDLPSGDQLKAVMESYPGDDIVFQQSAALRREHVNYGKTPGDPRFQNVEVLACWTKDRVMWILNRRWLLLDKKNPWGFIPYVKASPLPLPGRPFGMSIAEALRDDQEYATGIRNARLDNLALILNPPRKRIADAPITPREQSLYPGKEERVSDPSHLEFIVPQDVTAQAYQEEALIEARAARRFGVNELMMSGVPTPSNANRTATGVSQQVMAIGQRLRPLVERFEDYFLLPILQKIDAILRVKGQAIPPRVSFRLEASARVINRERLAMFLVPVTQFLFNPDVLEMAARSGKALDFDEWERFFEDAVGTGRRYRFFRTLTPEERAMIQTPPELAAQLQAKALEAETRLRMGAMKAQTELAKVKASAQAKMEETGEKSAREILKLLRNRTP